MQVASQKQNCVPVRNEFRFAPVYAYNSSGIAMMQRWISLAFFVAAFAHQIDAQIMATGGPISPDSLGSPPQAPFLTLLGMANPGKLATDPSIPPKGAVSEMFYEELRGKATPAGPAGAVEASVRTKFDEQGNVTEKIENRWNYETDSVYHYQDGRVVSMETTTRGGKKSARFWSYWTYDRRGKLIEYRRGSGAEIGNHELGFRYDSKGRLLGFDYRQGKEDKPFSHTEVSYSNDDRTVAVTKSFVDNQIVDRSTRLLDYQGRVVRVELDSEGRAPNNQAKNIRFRYDAQGRLVEQSTDAINLSNSGAEHDLPPGTITIAYDDKAHTKTTKYSFPGEGSMEIVVTQDASGAAVGYGLGQGSEKFSWNLECEYDRFGNWTTCRQIVEREGQKFTKQGFRRTITYR